MYFLFVTMLTIQHDIKLIAQGGASNYVLGFFFKSLTFQWVFFVWKSENIFGKPFFSSFRHEW
jgi:hypothetical protein